MRSHWWKTRSAKIVAGGTAVGLIAGGAVLADDGADSQVEEQMMTLDLEGEQVPVAVDAATRARLDSADSTDGRGERRANRSAGNKRDAGRDNSPERKVVSNNAADDSVQSGPDNSPDQRETGNDAANDSPSDNSPTASPADDSPADDSPANDSPANDSPANDSPAAPAPASDDSPDNSPAPPPAAHDSPDDSPVQPPSGGGDDSGGSGDSADGS
jgi:hypothetical protein